MTFKTNNMIVALGLGLGLSVSALAGETTVSRHSFAKFSASTAAPASQLQTAPVQPAAPRSSSISTTLTSDLTGATTAQLVSVPMRAAIASVEPTLAATAAVRQLPLVAASVNEADQAEEAQVDPRLMVDRNAQLAGNYSGYAPATVTHEQAQLALAAHRVEHVGYGNTYGTYAPAAYHGRFNYSYAPRTYYQPTHYYHAPRYYPRYTSTYCAPVYRPSYSYCPPVYRPSYSYGYYGRSYYNYPSYGFRYGYSSGCGSSFGFSIRW